MSESHDDRGMNGRVRLAEVVEVTERFARRNAWTVKAIEAWRSQIRVFARFLEEEEGVDDFREVDRAMLMRFQAWVARTPSPRKKMPYAKRSQCSFVFAVKQGFAALVDEARVLADPSVVLRYPRPARHIPKVLEQAQVRRVFELADLRTVLGYRDRALMEVLYSTLIRGGELAGLLLDDIKEEEHRLFIRGKGRRERVVPVGRIAWGYLVEYRDRIRPFLSPRSDHLFLGKMGEGLSTSRVGMIVGYYVDRAGCERDSGAHLLRYSGATHMIENGADIRQVQELLGHVSIGSTMGYCLTSAMALKLAHARSHPREKLR